MEVYSSLPCEGKIEKYISNSSTYAYPNPVSNYTNIIFPASQQKNTKEILVELIDSSGKIIIHNSYTINHNKVEINMSTLSPGLYFVKVYADEVETIKIIKK
ncbi:T9SS type A sorting domain-containing protein [Galbibacter sp. PAP.153]|uniref:T9SS type A sorting domain-containing protein n=1 Tax=Galbibacter sp. PAP.153 TaxID=3104623 RepID=UPI003008A7C6